MTEALFVGLVVAVGVALWAGVMVLVRWRS